MRDNLLALPRVLTKKNIDEAILNYKDILKGVPLTISAENILELLYRLKRISSGSGPYPDVSIFESSNRIMTDLVILFGVKMLLSGYEESIKFDSFVVEYGTDNKNAHDIEAENGDRKLIGEAFNVSESFFQTKKVKSLKKLRNSRKSNEIIVLLYNSDAVQKNYHPIAGVNEYYIPVDISL